MRSAYCKVAALAALGVLLAGCGGGSSGGRQAISGTVTYKGEPIPEGSIEFIPHPGVKTSGGGVITNGRYRIPADKGLEPGNYTVKFSSMEAPAVTDEPGGLPGKDPVERLPAKYNKNSKETVEIKPGQSTYDFKLD